VAENVERGRVGPADTNQGHLAQVHLVAVHAHGIRVFERLEDLTRVTVAGHCKTRHIDA